MTHLENQHQSSPKQSRQRLLWAAIFSMAMGLLEAICVVYLRKMFKLEGNDFSPIMDFLGKTRIEHWREACTMIMLLSVAWLAGFNWRSRIGFFFFMFGIWDILYYVGLHAWLQWPSSLLEWDCLFLIPKAWYGPVLAPVLISCYLIGACSLLIMREFSRFKLRLSFPVLALQLLGFGIWYWSFVKDTEKIMAQGYTNIHYSWLLFGVGMLSCLVGLVLAIWNLRSSTRSWQDSE